MVKHAKGKKIAVLMSGGVDSSVAAALLKRQGYDLAGFFMIFGRENPERKKEENKCCSLESQEIARRVAASLDIPFYTINLAGEFKRKVLDYFVGEYKSGRTPNPCVQCNKFIKFGVMLGRALALGFDYVATGHYIKSSKFPEGEQAPYGAGKVQSSKLSLRANPSLPRVSEAISFKLFKAKDKKKDQSYFLYTLTQERLKHLIFPLGNYKKTEVKEMARKFGLPVAQRKESQDVCFLVGKNIADFLKTKIKSKAGNIVDINSKKIIGPHQGLPFYTIGQRQGIGIGGTGPYYVVRLDFKKNILWVTRNPQDPQLFGRKLQVKEVNWITGREPRFPWKCQVQIRYNQKALPAVLQKGEGRKITVTLKKRARAITPGQAAVFYQEKELLGGGIISKN